MDCDDVMLALANRERTLTPKEAAQFHVHLEGCDECRAIAEDTETEWRWIARLPQDAFHGDGANLLALPTVDPIVFDIDQEIAKGGMGRITKATDRRLGRDVAVKEVLEPGLRARFEREAMITARLQHPAIVPIYEAGTFPNGNPFYTMRLVWGGTLGAAIHKTRTMRERLALLPHVLAVIDALAYAHDNRIIHRDLKPGNVLVGEFGETVVIDWGLAKELDSKIESAASEAPSRPSAARLTRVGSVLGTPGFMSPEQASGGTIDERADVYALGAILYNLLAGVPPYWDKHATEGSTQLIAIGLARPPTPIAELAPETPADLRTICERAMARRKEDRYPSAKEMAAELRRFSAGQLISREYTLRELIARWVKKHRTVVVISSIAVVTLAVVAVVAFVNVTRSQHDEQEMRVKAQAAEATAQRGVASLLEEQGLRELLAGDSNRALTYLAGAFEQRDTPALRYLLAAASDDLEKRHDTLPSAAAIAFDGNQVVTVEDQRIASWAGTRFVRSFAIGVEPVLDARFDETAKYVALRRALASHRTRLELWEVASSTRVWESDEQPIDAALPVFDRAGKRAASFARDKIAVREMATPKVATTLQVTSEIRDLAIDQAHVAACAYDGSVYVWDLIALDRPPRRLRPRPEAACIKLAFLDAKQLVIANKKYELLRWPVDQAAPDRTMSGHIPIYSINVDATKQRIATGDATGIVMWSWDGEALGESREVQGGIDKLAFSPDGNSLVGAGADDRVFVWDTDSFHLRRATSGGEGSIRGVAIANDRVATVGAATSHVWAMPGGRLVGRAPGIRSAISGDTWITATETEVVLRDLAGGSERQRIQHSHEPVELLAGDGFAVVVAKGGAQWVLDLRSPTPALAPGPNNVAMLTTHRRRQLEFRDARVSIVDGATGNTVATLEITPQPLPGRGDISPDGKYVALVFGSAVQVWNVETRALVSTTELPTWHAYRLRFDPTGKRFVMFGGTEPALLVETATGNRIATLETATSGDGAKFSKDGSRVAIGIGNTVQLWAVAPGAALDGKPGSYLFTVSSTITNAYALSDDGQLFATGSIDGSIRIWDSRGRLLDRLVGSQTGIIGLEWVGDRLLGQSDDRSSTIWDVHRDNRTKAEIRTFAAEHSNWRLEDAQIVPKR